MISHNIFSALLFKEDSSSEVVQLHVKDDDEAELAEHMSFRITSVHLVNGTVDPLGIPPSIDYGSSFVNLTINENDFPYGVIGFEHPTLIVHEWEGLVRIPVVRRGREFSFNNIIFTFLLY